MTSQALVPVKDFSQRFPRIVDVGQCLELFSSMFNHSCDPNAWWVFDGAEFQVRALRDIGKGEEVTISYVGSHLGFESRQTMLEDIWGIKCKCSLCRMGDLGPADKLLRKEMIELVGMGKADRSGIYLSYLQTNHFRL